MQDRRTKKVGEGNERDKGTCMRAYTTGGDTIVSIFLIPQLPPSIIIKRCSRVCLSVTDQTRETLLHCGSGGRLAGEYIIRVCVPCHFPVHSVTDFSTTNDHFLARSTCILPVLVCSFFFFSFFFVPLYTSKAKSFSVLSVDLVRGHRRVHFEE